MDTEVIQYIKETLYYNLGYDICQILAEEDVSLCGGALMCLYNGLPINDYDLYFKSIDSVHNTWSKLKSLYNGEMIKDVYETSNAITLSVKPYDDILKLQLVRRSDKMNSYTFDLLKTFDFTACMASFSFKTNKFECDTSFVIDNDRKELHLYNNKLTSGYSTFFRVRKYLNRGFTVEYNTLSMILQNLKIYRKKTTKLQRDLLKIKVKNEFNKVNYIHSPFHGDNKFNQDNSILLSIIDNKFREENLDNSDRDPDFY